MIAFLFFCHMINVLLILGQGWLLSHHICKTCQNYLCPSSQCSAEAWIVALFVKALANAIMQCRQLQLGQKQFWHVLQHWLLCSHPCTWKYYYAIMHWNQFCYIFLILRNLESNLGFLFLNSHFIDCDKSHFNTIVKIVWLWLNIHSLETLAQNTLGTVIGAPMIILLWGRGQ